MSVEIESNSIVIEQWFEGLEWQSKLAACLLFKLILADSKRLSRIGNDILKRLHKDVIQTDGVTTVPDMNIREMYLMLSE